MRQQTWFACIVCVLGTIPGFLAGGIAKILMGTFGGWGEAEGYDFLFLHALFGLEAPRLLYSWIFLQAIPCVFQGLIAGIVAVYITDKFCKGAKIDLAAHITGALYTGVFLTGTGLGLLMHNPTGEMILAAIQTVGLWVGLSSAVASLPAPLRTVTE